MFLIVTSEWNKKGLPLSQFILKLYGFTPEEKKMQ